MDNRPMSTRFSEFSSPDDDDNARKPRGIQSVEVGGQLLKVLAGAGTVSIREAARRVGRDVKAVHGDVTALLNAGVLRRTEDGIEFPYDAVHVDFVLKAA